MAVKIRSYTAEDLDEILALEQVCFSNPWSRSAFATLPLLDVACFFVAEDAHGRMIGYAGMYCVLDEGQIMNVATAPHARGKGVARALLSALFAEGARRGLTFYTLEVRASNLPAIGLYESFDFSEVGRRKNYYHNPTEDAILMTKTIEE